MVRVQIGIVADFPPAPRLVRRQGLVELGPPGERYVMASSLDCGRVLCGRESLQCSICVPHFRRAEDMTDLCANVLIRCHFGGDELRAEVIQQRNQYALIKARLFRKIGNLAGILRFSRFV